VSERDSYLHNYSFQKQILLMGDLRLKNANVFYALYLNVFFFGVSSSEVVRSRRSSGVRSI
jgi:uncharacterized membrane protein